MNDVGQIPFRSLLQQHDVEGDDVMVKVTADDGGELCEGEILLMMI